MARVDFGETHVNYNVSGPEDGPGLVLAHALGTDLHVWDAVVAALPEGLRVLRYDLRGHGGSACPDAPYYMGDLVQDAARLMDHLGMTEAVFVGLSLGGIVAQGLASERPDLLRGLVLSNTAARIGNHAVWHERVHLVRGKGLVALADPTMERWFARGTRRDRPELVAATRARFLATAEEGYVGCMEAIGETDLIESTARLRLPTLGIAASEDGSTPADLVRETVDSIPGSRFELIRRAGHMACVEQPQDYAAKLTGFLESIGHV